MLLGKLRVFSIIRGSLCEAPGLLGFILYLLGRQELDLYILCGLSFVLLSAFLPRQEIWEDFLNKCKP